MQFHIHKPKIIGNKLVLLVIFLCIYACFLLFQTPAPLPICSECLGTEAKNRHGVFEKLSACAECGSFVHLSCTTSGPELAVLLAKGGKWFCEECKTCDGCGK